MEVVGRLIARMLTKLDKGLTVTMQVAMMMAPPRAVGPQHQN